MNEKTAEHYNKLRKRSLEPLTLVKTGNKHEGVKIKGGSPPEQLALEMFVEHLRERFTPDAVAEEIRTAAKEGRAADTYTGDAQNSLLTWGQYNGHCDGAGGICLRLVMPLLQTEVERMNSLADQAYVEYRARCSQGTALPPG